MANGRKVVVFSYFRDVLDVVAPRSARRVRADHRLDAGRRTAAHGGHLHRVGRAGGARVPDRGRRGRPQHPGRLGGDPVRAAGEAVHRGPGGGPGPPEGGAGRGPRGPAVDRLRAGWGGRPGRGPHARPRAPRAPAGRPGGVRGDGQRPGPGLGRAGGRLAGDRPSCSTGPTIEHLVERVVAPLGLRADRTAPLVDARLPDGSRVNVALPPLAVDGPYLTIRRFRARASTLAEVCPPGVDALLAGPCGARANVVVAGGSGAGKTTLLNALAGRCPPASGSSPSRTWPSWPCPATTWSASRPGPANAERRRGGHHPRPGAQRPAHAPRPPRRRRGPGRRGPRPGAGHEHRSRRVAVHLSRQQPGRRPATAWPCSP